MKERFTEAEDSLPIQVTMGADENSLHVEIKRESVSFEREIGSIFEIGDCGKFTIVTAEEWDAFQALGKEYFELNHTENGQTIERLQLREQHMLKLVMEGAFVVGGRELSLIPVDFFARIFPPLKRDDGEIPPWAE